MKKFFTLVLFTISISLTAIQAQSVDIYSTDQNVVSADASSNIKAYLDVINTGDREILVDWRRQFDNLPSGWETWVCDSETCYTADVDENIIPNTIMPGDTSNWYIEVSPNNSIGTFDICLDIINNGDGSIIGEFCTNFALGVVSAEGNLTDTDAYLFPNPSRVFQLSESDGVERIMVSDIMGRQILDVNTIMSNTVNLSEARAGVYFATFLDGDNRKVGNQRIVVR